MDVIGEAVDEKRVVCASAGGPLVAQIYIVSPDDREAGAKGDVEAGCADNGIDFVVLAVCVENTCLIDFDDSRSDSCDVWFLSVGWVMSVSSKHLDGRLIIELTEL